MKRLRIANTAGIPEKGVVYVTGNINPKDNGYFTYDGIILTSDKQPFYKNPKQIKRPIKKESI